MKRFFKLTIAIALIYFVGKYILVYNSYKNIYVITSDLNVRTEPRMGSEILHVLQKGEKVEKYDKKGKWFKIKYRDNNGYVYSKYLKPVIFFELISLNDIKIIIAIILSFIPLFRLSKLYKKRKVNNLLQKVTTHSYKGEFAERKLVTGLLNLGFSPEMIFHDIYIEKRANEFSQIDLLLVTDVGIVVFEVKNYSGWIYGDGNSKYWTKVLAYGKQKYRFYNPVRQNYNHINVLRRKLGKYVSGIPFFSVILFYGDCNLKNINYIPKGTFVGKSEKLMDIIETIILNNPPVKYIYLNEIKEILKEAVIKGENIEVKKQHIENIEELTGKKRIFI